MERPAVLLSHSSGFLGLIPSLGYCLHRVPQLSGENSLCLYILKSWADVETFCQVLTTRTLYFPKTQQDFVPQSCIKINNKIKSWRSMQLMQSNYNEQLFQYFCKRCHLFFYFHFFWWGLQGRQAEKVSPDKPNHGPTPPGASSDIFKPTVRNNLSWS